MKYSAYPKPELMERVFDHLGVRITPRMGWQSIHCVNKAAHSHEDRNKSASVNMTVGYYKCHGCGMKGDGWDVMREVEGLDFKQAAATLSIKGSIDTMPEEETWITWRE